MPYSDLLGEENISSQYLATIEPRRFVAEFDATSGGDIYSTTFDYGLIVQVKLNDDIRAEASSVELIDGDWFFDETTKTLTLKIPLFEIGGPGLKRLYVTYRLFFGTLAQNFHLDPTDSSTKDVYWEPLLLKAPEIKQNTSNSAFGFLTTQSSQMVFLNGDNFFQKHAFDSSFNESEFKLYHYLGDLKTENVKEIIAGVCGDFTFTPRQFTIKVFDLNYRFDSRFSYPNGPTFYSSSTYPNIRPEDANKPIRAVFGRRKGFVGVNLNYDEVQDNTVNDLYGIMHMQDEMTVFTTQGSGSTTTRTYIDSDIFSLYDTVVIESPPNQFSDVTTVTAVGSGFIDHYEIENPGVAGAKVYLSNFKNQTQINSANGNVTLNTFFSIDGFNTGDWLYHDSTSPYYAKLASIDPNTQVFNLERDRYPASTNNVQAGDASTRFFISAGKILQNGLLYDLIPVHHYFQKMDVDNYVIAVKLRSGKLSQPDGLIMPNPNDVLSFSVYGPDNTLGFGSNGSRGANLSLPSLVIYKIMNYYAGIASSRIDTAQFTSLAASTDVELGFALPDSAQGGFQNYDKILASLTSADLLKLVFNNDNQYTLEKAGPATSGKTLANDEILEDSFKYSINYNDTISDVVVEYDLSEIDEAGFVTGLQYTRSRGSNDVVRNLHLKTSEKTFKVPLFYSGHAGSLRSRLSSILGERQSKITVQTKNRFFDTTVGDTITLSLDQLPGFDFVEGTERTRKFKVLGFSKNLEQITLELEDQKGIEDNPGGF